jgi:hypothetical protein
LGECDWRRQLQSALPHHDHHDHASHEHHQPRLVPVRPCDRAPCSQSPTRSASSHRCCCPTMRSSATSQPPPSQNLDCLPFMLMRHPSSRQHMRSSQVIDSRIWPLAPILATWFVHQLSQRAPNACAKLACRTPPINRTDA